jgi:anaerobic selenocysteine-containing dehydrogenase
VANGQMLAELAEVRLSLPDARFDLRLIPRRVQHVFNSSHHHASTAHGGPANSAYLHPDDLADRGLAADDEVVIESGVGRLRTTVKADAGLRRGVVSMTHCYGGLPDEGTQIGANLGLIVGLDDLQPHTGQPVMSNIPVAVARADARANS